MDVPEQLTLPDGRLLDVRVSGPADGATLVYHHGTPGSALAVRAIERAAHRRGLRVVTASRPGYGSSTAQPGRRVLDVVADTRAVLGHLGVGRCLVAGWSGGGPHALACAARLDGVDAALVIAGVAPYGAEGLAWMDGMGADNLAEYGAAVEGEEALRRFLVEAGHELAAITAGGLVGAMATLLPEVDRAVLTDEFGEDMVAGMREGTRMGVEGWLEDDLAFTGPWGFELAEIAVPTAIWQGSEDLMVPFAHGRCLAALLPSASVHLEDGEGHLSVALGAIDRMLDELVVMAAA